MLSTNYLDFYAAEILIRKDLSSYNLSKSLFNVCKVSNIIAYFFYFIRMYIRYNYYFTVTWETMY